MLQLILLQLTVLISKIGIVDHYVLGDIEMRLTYYQWLAKDSPVSCRRYLIIPVPEYPGLEYDCNITSKI